MRIRRAYLAATLTATTVAVACTLNPQPLPPEQNAAAGDDGGVFGSADAAPGFDPSRPLTDAGATGLDGGPGADGDGAPPAPEPDAGDGGPDASDEDGG